MILFLQFAALIFVFLLINICSSRSPIIAFRTGVSWLRLHSVGSFLTVFKASKLNFGCFFLKFVRFVLKFLRFAAFVAESAPFGGFRALYFSNFSTKTLLVILSPAALITKSSRAAVWTAPYENCALESSYSGLGSWSIPEDAIAHQFSCIRWAISATRSLCLSVFWEWRPIVSESQCGWNSLVGTVEASHWIAKWSSWTSQYFVATHSLFLKAVEKE